MAIREDRITPGVMGGAPTFKRRGDVLDFMADRTAAPPRNQKEITQDVVVLNDYGLTRRDRTTTKFDEQTGDIVSRKTKSRFSINIESEPVLHDFNAIRLGREVNETIRDVLARQLATNTHTVSPNTLAYRKYAKEAYKRGSEWAMERYSGGRTGPTPPRDGERVGHFSGRLADTLHVRQNPKEGAWTVNVAANRLTPDTSRTDGQYMRMVERIQKAVPELGNPAALMVHREVRDEIEATISAMIAVATAKNKALRARLMREVLGLWRRF